MAYFFAILHIKKPKDIDKYFESPKQLRDDLLQGKIHWWSSIVEKSFDQVQKRMQHWRDDPLCLSFIVESPEDISNVFFHAREKITISKLYCSYFSKEMDAKQDILFEFSPPLAISTKPPQTERKHIATMEDIMRRLPHRYFTQPTGSKTLQATNTTAIFSPISKL